VAKDPKENEKASERSERDDDARRGSPRLGDLAKKIFSTGAEAMHLTEEGLRNVLGDVSPREAVSGLFESVSKGTDTLQSIFMREARRYLDAINFRDELGRVLANYTIEINAKVNFVPREKPPERRRGRHADKDARIETEAFKVKFVAKEGAEEPEAEPGEKKG
jgi:hypothetical protein